MDSGEPELDVRWLCHISLLSVESETFWQLLFSNTQVVSDPYDIKMADPYAGENVADYDM